MTRRAHDRTGQRDLPGDRPCCPKRGATLRGLLWVLVCAWFLSGTSPAHCAGEVPGVSARFVAGQVEELPAVDPTRLLQRELYPDQPFEQPLEPASLLQFRDFYTSSGLSLLLAPAQVRALQDALLKDTVVKQQVESFLQSVQEAVDRPLPGEEPTAAPGGTAPQPPRDNVQIMSALIALRQSCALAFAVTGEEHYAQKSWEAMQACISRFYLSGVLKTPLPWQSPLSEGYELYDAASAYDLIAHWEGLHPLDHALVFNYLRRLGQRAAYAVELSPVLGADQVVWTCGLGCIALYAPSLPEAPRWRALVEERLNSVMADFMADGGQIECDPGRQALVLDQLLRYLKVARQLGDNQLMERKWGETEVTLQSALNWAAQVATPLGELPGINDSLTVPLAACSWFLDAISLYQRGDWLRAGRITPAEVDFLHPIAAGLEPRDPEFRSVLLADTGFAVLRDDWSEASNYLLFDWGRHGGGHGHFDRLNFLLYAQGQPWVLDAGSAPEPNAAPELQESWHRQTLAHNTVLVDRQSQGPVDGKLVAFHSRPRYDVVAAESEAYPDLTHRRTVFHPRGGYVLILDELLNRATRERPAEWLLHVSGRRESGTAGRFVFWREGGFGLSAVFARGLGLRGATIDEGLCGGYDGVSPAFDPLPEGPALKPGDPGWETIPYIGLRKVIAPGATGAYCVLLQPFKGTEPEVTVEATQTPQAYLVEVHSGNQRDRIVVRRRDAAGGMARGMDLATDAGYAFVREHDDQVVVLEYEDGSSLSIN